MRTTAWTRFRLDVELVQQLIKFWFSALPYLPQMQVAGQPWAKDAAIPVITLNAFNAPYRNPTTLSRVYLELDPNVTSGR